MQINKLMVNPKISRFYSNHENLMLAKYKCFTVVCPKWDTFYLVVMHNLMSDVFVLAV